MQRVIFHIDQNSYFATVEQQVNPSLRGKPIGVTQGPGYRTVVVAASVEAKQWGVKTGMTVYEARQFCPHLILVDGDLEKYHAVSGQLLSIYKDYTPFLEIFSIDEVFLDCTAAIDGRVSVAVRLAQEIKQRIRAEVGSWLSCSIGIAENKLLAKLASGMHKPDGLTVITHPRVLALRHPRPTASLPSQTWCGPGARRGAPTRCHQRLTQFHVYTVSDALCRSSLTDMCGIGPAIERRLHAVGVRTFADLQKIPLSVLIMMFGHVRGTWLYRAARGIDHSPVVPYYDEHDPKSVGQRKTFPTDVTDRRVVQSLVELLAYQVAYRLRKYGKRGRTIHLWMRSTTDPCSGSPYWGMGERVTRHTHTNDGKMIAEVCWNLFTRMEWEGSVRMIGISVDNLVDDDVLTQPLFFDEVRQDKLHAALDTVNDRFGPGTLAPASLLGHRAIPAVNGFGKGIAYEVGDQRVWV
ncbi:MAG: DNA polymerase IV [bacterium]|nr:DNA polymerase IV [bacterium]